MRFQLGELALGAVTADIGDPEWKIVHQWANDRDEDTCRTGLRVSSVRTYVAWILGRWDRIAI